MSRSLGTVGPPPGLTAVPVEDATEEDSRVAVAESVRLPEPLALGLGVPVAVVEVAAADDHDHEPRNRQRIFFQKKTTTNFPFSRKPFSKLKKTFKQPLKKKREFHTANFKTPQVQVVTPSLPQRSFPVFFAAFENFET